MKRQYILAILAAFFLVAGCSTRHQIDSRHEVTVAPVEVKPIHITIDINIKVDRELENFFDDIDKAAGSVAGGKGEGTQ